MSPLLLPTPIPQHKLRGHPPNGLRPGTVPRPSWQFSTHLQNFPRRIPRITPLRTLTRQPQPLRKDLKMNCPECNRTVLEIPGTATYDCNVPGCLKFQFCCPRCILNHMGKHVEILDTKLNRTCEWVVDEDGIFDTGCGNKFEFMGGGPKENCFAYCPYCGGKLAVHDGHN